MDSKPTYIKMGELVDQDFTVKSVESYKYVAWDSQTSKYVTDDKWFAGASKKYPIDTDKGKVDMSATQVGNMFEGVQHSGRADIIGATFHVKSNGKQGMDIRYFLNPVKAAPQQSGYDQARTQADSLRKPDTQSLDQGFNDEPFPEFQG